SIHDAVIVGQGEIHHRPDDDFAIAGDRPVFDRMKSEDTALRGIDDWSGQHRAVYTAVADGECSALQLVDFELVLLSTVGKIGDRFFYFCKGHVFDIAQNGNNQALAAANRDTNVVVLSIHNVRTTNLGVDLRYNLESFNRCLHEE